MAVPISRRRGTREDQRRRTDVDSCSAWRHQVRDEREVGRPGRQRYKYPDQGFPPGWAVEEAQDAHVEQSEAGDCRGLPTGTTILPGRLTPRNALRMSPAAISDCPAAHHRIAG